MLHNGNYMSFDYNVDFVKHRPDPVISLPQRLFWIWITFASCSGSQTVASASHGNRREVQILSQALHYTSSVRKLEVGPAVCVSTSSGDHSNAPLSVRASKLINNLNCWKHHLRSYVTYQHILQLHSTNHVANFLSTNKTTNLLLLKYTASFTSDIFFKLFPLWTISHHTFSSKNQ